MSFYRTQLTAISSFSDYIVCERIHHHTFTHLPPPPPLLLPTGAKKLKWFDSALRSEGRKQRKLLVGSSLTVIWDSVLICTRRKKKVCFDKERGNLSYQSYEIHDNETAWHLYHNGLINKSKVTVNSVIWPNTYSCRGISVFLEWCTWPAVAILMKLHLVSSYRYSKTPFHWTPRHMEAGSTV